MTYNSKVFTYVPSWGCFRVLRLEKGNENRFENNQNTIR